ncbi:telomere repeats-binding bouquet formation protein 2 isoform X3 [Symphalangus syndactylus]|uniref:telomere repeats-binding bouquet formation protein 2 isoform X3 n=1 Tax=Symphalangus syndactylus TaxID=9590 RepID=UPI002442B91C|nr:telomere repeats-binding bouquet formation protein 2 isoform X3 [Symphalangus syndactylus]
MFQGQRGWFCGSVSRDLRQFWVAEGGTISDPRAADFLFSCDASHPDTLRIYQSLDYIEDNATVFHAYYLSAVANAEIKNSVALGHFILPPACLQKEIRRKIGSFIWEQDQHFLIEKHDEVTPNEIKTLRENSELATEHKKELSERGKHEYSSSLPHIMQSSFPHLGKSQWEAHLRNAMDEPHPGKTTFMIMASPLPDILQTPHLMDQLAPPRLINWLI